MATISNEFPVVSPCGQPDSTGETYFGHICFCGQNEVPVSAADEQENMMATTKKSLETLSAIEMCLHNLRREDNCFVRISEASSVRHL